MTRRGARMHRRSSGLTWCGLAVILAGCGSASSPPPARLTESAPSRPAVAAPASEVAAQEQPAPPAPAPAPAPPASPFVAVAQPAHGARHLFPIEGALLVEGYAQLNVGEDNEWYGFVFGVVQPDGTVDYPTSLRKHAGAWWPVDIAGRWPDMLDMTAAADGVRAALGQHWTLGPRGWEIRNGAYGSNYVGIAKIGASVVALEASTSPYLGASRFVTLRGPKVGLKLTPASRDKCSMDGTSVLYQDAAVRPRALGTTRDGQVLSYGWPCDDVPSLEVWKPGEKTSTLLRLENAPQDQGPSDPPSILTGAANDAWILDGFLTHFDGATWKNVDLPAPRAYIFTGAVGGDGTLWVKSNDGVLFARRGETWERVPLPGDLKADDVAATSDGVVWVAANDVLLRLRKPGEEGGPAVPLDRAQERAPEAPRPALRRPGSPGCPRNLVVLYSFSKVTPDDYDFPLTRKALKGHTELAGARFAVTRDGGKKFFTALVPSFSLGQKLSTLVRQKVQGSSPTIVCADPEVVREVKLDLKSGEIIR